MNVRSQRHDFVRSAHELLAPRPFEGKMEFVSIKRKEKRGSGIHCGKNLSSFVKTSSHHAGSGFVSYTLAQSISYRRKLIKEGSSQY